VKLLRAIQEREVERIGGTATVKVDVRIVAATNEPLRALVERGEFREDLFYRLNVFPIHVPPLRDRREDIPDLMAYYLKWYNRLHGREIGGFSFRATKALLNYHYPGNIRELQNLIERAVILTEDDTIEVSSLFAYGESLGAELWGLDVAGKLSPYEGADWAGQQVGKLGEELARLAEGDGTLSWPMIEERLFASLARKVLAELDGNISAAARQLGMKRHQLEYRLKQLGLMSSDKPRS
jgi:transcriptional regulator with GAF, ATPase, and Fis domain